ncbi:MAG: hypothetical protein O3B01_07185 [Planctomycetota bacterium]|nr:hypothetical protein [Planctomycetota bacterium]MDA1138352.1 hypothetical protein [Planctomycetota bacterium]
MSKPIAAHSALFPAKSSDPGGPFDPAEVSPERRDEIIDYLALTVVRRKLQTPAIFFLELNKPISTVASSMITFAQPTFGAFFGFKRMAEWAALLDERENVELLIQRIESLTGDSGKTLPDASPKSTGKMEDD